MHGVKKVAPVAETDEQKDAKLKKIAKYTRLCQQALNMHQNSVYNEEGMQLSTKIIELNPDYYTMWNFRKELVLAVVAQNPENRAALCEQELELTLKALQRNPKGYCAWHHRLWAVDLGSCSLQRELELCAKYLSLDSRNFHTWDYRGFIVKRMKAYSLKQEFDFTTQKINENFSNYSAWHYRSSFLARMFANAELTVEQIYGKIDEEFEMVKQAFYTEPNDQSAWLYHRWLVASSAVKASADGLPALGALSLTSNPLNDIKAAVQQAEHAAHTSEVARSAANLERHAAVLSREIKMCEELLEMEPDCKWAVLTVAQLLHGQQIHGITVPDYEKKITELLDRLVRLDPLRRNYYTHLLSQFRQLVE